MKQRMTPYRTKQKTVSSMRIVTFKVDEELLKVLDLYCVNNKLHRSEVIRDAIRLYLSKGIENKEGGVESDA